MAVALTTLRLWPEPCYIHYAANYGNNSTLHASAGGSIYRDFWHLTPEGGTRNVSTEHGTESRSLQTKLHLRDSRRDLWPVSLCNYQHWTSNPGYYTLHHECQVEIKPGNNVICGNLARKVYDTFYNRHWDIFKVNRAFTKLEPLSCTYHLAKSQDTNNNY